MCCVAVCCSWCSPRCGRQGSLSAATTYVARFVRYRGMSAPFLPGFVSNRTKAAPRPQSLSSSGGIVFEKLKADAEPVDYTKHIVDRGLKAREIPTKDREVLLTTKRVTAAATRTVAPYIPVEVELDRQVCARVSMTSRVGSVTVSRQRACRCWPGSTNLCLPWPPWALPRFHVAGVALQRVLPRSGARESPGGVACAQGGHHVVPGGTCSVLPVDAAVAPFPLRVCTVDVRCRAHASHSRHSVPPLSRALFSRDFLPGLDR